MNQEPIVYFSKLKYWEFVLKCLFRWLTYVLIIVHCSLLEEFKDNTEEFNVNCVDPLNRSALIAAIENENIDLIKILLEYNIEVHDALLHAISEEYVEGVELLLYHEETHHEPGKPYVILKTWCN